MTPMTDTTTAAPTTDTVEELATIAGHKRDFYYLAVDIVDLLPCMEGATPRRVEQAIERAKRAEESWSEADGKFREAFLDASRSHSAAGVAFVLVSEYAREWAAVTGWVVVPV